MKIGLITFSQKLLLNLCFQQLENTKFNPHFSPTQNTQPTYTHTSTITAWNTEVISSLPSQLINTSKTSNSNLCHSSVREVAIPPLRGKEGDLSLCLNKATDLGYSNVSGIVSDVASVCTNSSDKSVPRSAIAIPPLRGKEGGESHIINLVAEGDEFELDRDWSKSLESYNVIDWQR